MKPRTKLQLQVVKVAETLPEITTEQQLWGFIHCFDHKGYRTKKNGIVCLDCGHRFDDVQPHLLTTIDGCTCPNCQTKLKITDTRKRKDFKAAYYGIITTHKGFQVCRYFELTGNYKVGERPYLHCKEIVQHWILPNGKYEIRALNHAVTWYADHWNGEMAIRVKSESYQINPYKVYPKMRVLPEIKRNGFRSGFYNIAPSKLFRAILTNSHAETLLKAKQIPMLKKCLTEEYGKFAVSGVWSAIKICLRNNYLIKDAGIWMDYIENLEFFNKDVRNAKYVCPADLNKEHDRWMKKKRKRLELERIEQLKQKACDAEREYEKTKGKFFGLQFGDGLITVKVLESVNEVMREGDALHHCVFTNKYHCKKDSLLLSAQINGERIETVEFSLKKLEVIQCRGLHNANSEYHERIIELVQANKPKIARCLKPEKATV